MTVPSQSPSALVAATDIIVCLCVRATLFSFSDGVPVNDDSIVNVSQNPTRFISDSRTNRKKKRFPIPLPPHRNRNWNTSRNWNRALDVEKSVRSSADIGFCYTSPLMYTIAPLRKKKRERERESSSVNKDR